MNRFMKGMLLGIGIGMLVAPMPGEELRKKIVERLQQYRGYLPEGEQLDLYKQQVSERVSQTTNSVKGYAKQAASAVKTSTKRTASDVGGTAQNAASTIKQTGEDTADMTKDVVKTAKTDRNV
jgi:gas vesicle protein